MQNCRHYPKAQTLILSAVNGRKGQDQYAQGTIGFSPGMMCDISLFEHQLIDLAVDRSVNVTTITQGTTIAEIAKSVLRDAPAKFALAGLRMGGIVAMEILRLAPERLTKLALMDTNPLAETPQVAAGREPHIIKVKTGQMFEVIRDEMKPNYLGPGPHRMGVLNLVMDMALKLGPDAFVR
jgi:pimeloyl-ACP methyl ester carboxylesterase